MTLRNFVEDLIGRLRSEGWRVDLGPQEHLSMETEIVVDVNDVKLELESPETYVVELRVAVHYLAKNRLEMLDNLEHLIRVCDEGAYKVEDVGVDVVGEMMVVMILVLYREVMNV